MSIESAKAFIERMKTDEKFASQVMECKDQDSRMGFVKGEGYEFTVEEITAQQEQLSPQDLETITGGAQTTSCWQMWDDFPANL